MIICFFVFCGFCHAFLVLDNGVPRIPGFPRPGHEAEQAEIETNGSNSYGHLLVITGYKWDYKFYKWGFLSTYNW